MKILKKKKGFTIVELVIVIAVIAVLAAVLIPTFISLTNKANKASDDSLLKNINTALATQEQMQGDTKNNTMYDAVEDLKEYGYLLPNLVTKSDEKLLWEQKTNRFLYESNADEEHPLDYWKIQEDLSEQKYNVFAGVNFSAEDEHLSSIKVGFDAGYHEDLETMKYVGNGTSSQTVSIRTNGGALTINAELDHVNHYGYAESLNVEAVAPDSLREFGQTGYVKLKTGRLVVEKEAKIEGVYLVATEGEFDGIKVAVVTGAQLPTFARAEVTLEAGTSKLVFEIQTLASSQAAPTTTEFVWISREGDEISSTVSSSNNQDDYEEHVVVNPTPAASIAKEEVKEESEPVTDNSVARIGAIGYESFKEAVYAAKPGEKIALLKDFSITENIGDSTAEPYEDGLKNEVYLIKDIKITFVGATQLQFNQGGKINTNGYELSLTATTANAGLYLVEIDENKELRHAIDDSKTILVTSDDLTYLTVFSLNNYVKYDGEKWVKSGQITVGGQDATGFPTDNPPIPF